MATCQLCTFLTEVEFVAGDFPAKWMYRIPQEFLEVKSFLATQVMDEARHQEVFRKRAIAGGGLLHAAPGFEWALKAILDAPTRITSYNVCYTKLLRIQLRIPYQICHVPLLGNPCLSFPIPRWPICQPSRAPKPEAST